MSDLKNLQPGDQFFYKNVGYGLTTHEIGDTIIENRGDTLYTECFDSMGLKWNDLTAQWEFDGGLGLVTSIVGWDDPQAREECAEEMANSGLV